jgi:hypothetical protein
LRDFQSGAAAQEEARPTEGQGNMTSSGYQLDLVKVKYSASARLGREVEDFGGRFIVEEIAGDLYARFVMELAELNDNAVVIYSHPTTWWDALKRDMVSRLPWLGRWLRYRETEKRWALRVIFPDLRLAEGRTGALAFSDASLRGAASDRAEFAPAVLKSKYKPMLNYTEFG